MSTPLINLPSPAKLNLFLHILRQRDDGYHELQTLFHFVDYCDRMSFYPNNTLVIEQASSSIADDDNLVMKAALALQNHTDCTLGATIHLQKNIAMGGGLGGGSSNAATTLIALNRLWDTQLSLDELATIATPLGADIPVFVKGQTAWGEGIGEKLTPLTVKECFYLVLIPPVAVDTGKIFSHPQLTRDTSAITIAAFLEHGGHNDCESIVRKCYPEVAEALDYLGLKANMATQINMTGTGSCVFAAFNDKNDAEAIAKACPKSFRHFISKGCNSSPLHQSLGLL